MKQITLIFIFILISLAVFAQEKQDVVYLKNGSVIKGQITEMIPDKHVKIETNGGNLFVYSFAEIEKIEKNVNGNLSPFTNNQKQTSDEYLSDYYTQSSIGGAIGGGGLLGVTYRYFITEQAGIEGGALYRPGIYEDYYGDIQFTSSAMIAVGPVYYYKAFKNYKGKIKKNGVSAKIGFSPIGELKEFMGAVNWVHDSYRPENKDRYFSFELGAGVINRYELPIDASSDISSTVPVLYWKLNWFFGM